MRVQFWGTRGSLAKPGLSTVRYGGNTSCVEMRSSRGTLIITDCGTGANGLGQSLLAANPKGVRGHILISHTHWDHIQGLPFFAPLFIPGNEWDVYGPVGLNQSMREALSGQMQYTYFPVTMEQFGAKVRYHDLVEGNFRIDDVNITTRYLNHPALTLGYRLEADGATVVYSCDHEPYSRALAGGVGPITGHDDRHAEFLRGADLVIHDAQYTAQEYPAKVGWGHSPVEYVVAIARHAGVPKLALTHHDPARGDDALDRLVGNMRDMLRTSGSTLEVFAAAEGQSIEVTPPVPPQPRNTSNDTGASDWANSAIDFALEKRFAALAVSNPESASIFAAAIKAENVPLKTYADPGQVAASLQTELPSLVVLEHNPPVADGLTICRAIRQLPSAEAQSLPVIMVADREDTEGGEAAGVTEWVTRPFTASLVRTKVRAWILRTACRWKQAPIPEDEESRLAALDSLAILDTGPEPRFDRLTALATAVFDVPIAMINLVGRDRTQFKSCMGFTTGDGPRESSFCAHVVYSRKVMIVPDMLRDPRFADNPHVTGEPHVRFYAGAPIILHDGSCVGTLCLIDTRARALEGVSIKLLEDLRDLALQELEQKNPAAGEEK
jgi:phosphoribosyl 1,2-cyclic phosphodiesterase/CheY-like chemotaxis protein